MEPDSSLPHLQVPATCFYLESARSSPYHQIPLPEDTFWYYPPIYAWVSQVVSFPQVSHRNSVTYYSRTPLIRINLAGPINQLILNQVNSLETCRYEVVQSKNWKTCNMSSDFTHNLTQIIYNYKAQKIEVFILKADSICASSSNLTSQFGYNIRSTELHWMLPALTPVYCNNCSGERFDRINSI
jgi:hypothetical protein